MNLKILSDFTMLYQRSMPDLLISKKANYIYTINHSSYKAIKNGFIMELINRLISDQFCRVSWFRSPTQLKEDFL